MEQTSIKSHLNRYFRLHMKMLGHTWTLKGTHGDFRRHMDR